MDLFIIFLSILLSAFVFINNHGRCASDGFSVAGGPIIAFFSILSILPVHPVTALKTLDAVETVFEVTLTEVALRRTRISQLSFRREQPPRPA